MIGRGSTYDDFFRVTTGLTGAVILVEALAVIVGMRLLAGGVAQLIHGR